VKSIKDIVALIATEAARRQPGEWITGRGWDEGKFEEMRYIYAADLDRAAPSNPVWLVHTMGHYGAANGAALTLAKVARDTPDPPVGHLVPAFTPAQQREAIADLAQHIDAGNTGYPSQSREPRVPDDDLRREDRVPAAGGRGHMAKFSCFISATNLGSERRGSYMESPLSHASICESDAYARSRLSSARSRSPSPRYTSARLKGST